MLLRVRLTSFLVGFGVASGFAFYQLRQDLHQSHGVLLQQADEYKLVLEKRLKQLEATVFELRAQKPSELAAQKSG